MSSIGFLVKFNFLCVVVLFSYAFYNIHQPFGRKQNILSLGTDCMVPPHPSHGWCSILYPTNDALLSTMVSTGTMLHIYCNESYKLNGYNRSICLDGSWFPEIGKCLKTCPSMVSTPFMKVRCSYDNKMMTSCEGAIDNTRAQFICAPFYEDERSTRIKAMCRNGEWSQGVPQCVPVCGRRKAKKAVPLIVNGTISEIGEFPWQVAIYKNEQNICGGTLLHERLILTAAHCLSNEDGKPYPTEQYRVIVGNYHRLYKEACREGNAQISTIHAIFISEDYVGSDRLYYGDIALIVPNNTFQLSSTVQPICIDWTNEYENNLLYLEKPMGIVSGWGYTIEYCQSATVLRSLDVPIIDRDKCTQLFSKIEYQEYITQDKICAGYINKSKSVCHGDSGSGLMFSHKGRYYISGIVSISLHGRSENGGCDSQNLAFYTQVSKYLDDLIWNYYMRFKPFRLPLANKNFSNDNRQTMVSTSSEVPTVATSPLIKIFKINKLNISSSDACILPKNPKFGQWSLHGTAKNTQPKYLPGMLIKSGTILKIKCQKGYMLHGDKMVVCENSTWSSSIGECLKICPSLYSTKTMTITCVHKMGNLESCIDPIHGTIAKYHCAPFYEDVKVMEHPIYCMNGSWSPGLPQCVPKCGHKCLADPVYGKSNSLRDFPWIIAIYRKVDKEMICSGTLLTEKIIFVAYKCLKGYENNKNNITLVAGNSFRKLNESQNLEKIQTSNIRDVVMHQGQRFGDLAFIIVDKPFRFSLTVQPICIDWDMKFHKDNREGYVSGWGYSVHESKLVANYRLTTTEVDLVSLGECRMNLAEDYMNMTDEKLCVRYRSNGTSSCLGEEGGGLFARHSNKYYIVGVMDVWYSYNKKDCVDRQYSLYTPIYTYMDTFLETHV